MARLALDETVEFDKAINTSIQLLKQWNMLDDTLIIVTSDHTNSLSINGYPKRNTNILDIAGESRTDEVKYTTLTYSIGYSPNYIYKRQGSNVIRQDPSAILKPTSHEYSQQVGIMDETGVHGGGDVVVYAQGKCLNNKLIIQCLIPKCSLIGPMGHLFHSIHEQNYIAHAIAYAAKIGPYEKGLNNKSEINFSNIYLTCTLFFTLFYL